VTLRRERKECHHGECRGSQEEKQGKRESVEKRVGMGSGMEFEFKLRCVKLRLEEGIPLSLISKEVGSSEEVIRRWTKAYQEQGETGLRNPIAPRGSRRKLPSPVRLRRLQHIVFCKTLFRCFFIFHATFLHIRKCREKQENKGNSQGDSRDGACHKNHETSF